MSEDAKKMKAKDLGKQHIGMRLSRASQRTIKDVTHDVNEYGFEVVKVDLSEDRQLRMRRRQQVFLKC